MSQGIDTNLGSIPLSLLELLAPAGLLTTISTINKFGHCTDADSGVATDVWDRANPTHTQPIWVPPTASRIHAIVSTSANDAAAGTGARTIRVYGLTSWDEDPIYEDITLNGLTPVNTVNSYVIIYRIHLMTAGSGGVNVGYITATAASDGTVTAQINPDQGQTQMAIFAIPSTKDFYVTNCSGSINRAASTAMDMRLLANPTPDVNLNMWLVKGVRGANSTGTGELNKDYKPYLKVPGPCMMKVQAITTANNCDVSACFDGYLIDKET